MGTAALTEKAEKVPEFSFWISIPYFLGIGTYPFSRYLDNLVTYAACLIWILILECGLYQHRFCERY
jgi:hypothetical protein